MVNALGMAAVQIPWGETVPALASGAVELPPLSDVHVSTAAFVNESFGAKNSIIPSIS